MEETVADLLGTYAKTYMADKPSGRKRTPDQKRWNTFMLALISLLIPLLPKLLAVLRTLITKVQEWLSPQTEDNTESVSLSVSSTSSSSSSDTEDENAAQTSTPSPSSAPISQPSQVFGASALGDLVGSIFTTIKQARNGETAEKSREVSSSSHSEEDDTPVVKGVSHKDARKIKGQMEKLFGAVASPPTSAPAVDIKSPPLPTDDSDIFDEVNAGD